MKNLYTCWACKGNKKCIECHGSGNKNDTLRQSKITCPKCSGTGACTICQGSGFSSTASPSEALQKIFTQPLMKRCPFCSTALPLKMKYKWEWDCPECGHKNFEHPAYYNCEKCHYGPNMGPCPNCKKLINLFNYDN